MSSPTELEEMAAASASIIAHVSVGSNDYDKAIAFYDKIMTTLGAVRIVEVPGFAVAYGKQFPEFWVQKPYDGGKAQRANGTHFAFLADSKEAVEAFYEAGIRAGASCDGQPGPRPDYSDAYYGCFLRDPEGHKIEAMYWDYALAPVSAA
ncbi:MAG: VOC family protein [Halioglobus sp.]